MRKSRDKGLAITAGLPTSNDSESHIKGKRNPHRFRLGLTDSRHYIGLLQKHVGSSSLEASRLKKFLYALRPAIALRWMEVNEYRSLPPMNMLECMESARLPGDVHGETLQLIQTKMQTRELGVGLPHPILQAFVAETSASFSGARQALRPTEPEDGWRKARAETFYRNEVLGTAT